MKTKSFLILLALLFSIASFSQNQNPPEKIVRYDHALGIGAGFTTGFGFSYKYCPQKFGFMINFGPYMEEYGKTATYSLGLTFMKKISENPFNNFYVYLSNAYYYNKSRDYNYYYYPTYKYTVTEQWNTGLGLGFEFDSRKRVVMNIMVGYAQYNTFEMLLPTIEATLHYRFNGNLLN